MSARYAKAVLKQVYDIDLFGTGATAGFESESPNSQTCTHLARCISPRQEDDNTLLNYLNDAFEASCPSKACKWVLIVLANHANEKGECWPSIGRICRHTGLSESPVHRALKQLTDTGFITITPKTGRTNHYTIKTTPRHSDTPTPLHSDTPPPVTATPKPSYNHHNKQPPISPLQGKSNMKSQGSLFPNHSFQENMVLKIYETYPRKISKPPWHRLQALKAIKEALREIKPEKLLKLTEEYAEVRATEDEQFTPFPAKWFREKRYEDDPEDWKDKFGKDEEEKTLADKIAEEQDIQSDARAKEVENMWANPPADWGVK